MVASVFALPVTFTVPPPVATNAGLKVVDSSTVPLRVIVAPVFPVKEMPPASSPPSVIPPDSVTTPPVRPVISTEAPVPFPMDPA